MLCSKGIVSSNLTPTASETKQGIRPCFVSAVEGEIRTGKGRETGVSRVGRQVAKRPLETEGFQIVRVAIALTPTAIHKLKIPLYI